MIFSRCRHCRCFGLLLRHAEASTGLFTPPNSAWRQIDGRWLCPLPVRANSLVVDTLDFNIYAVTESSSGVTI
jgi:hypothetical protein